jgi:hypothetical protein
MISKLLISLFALFFIASAWSQSDGKTPAMPLSDSERLSLAIQANIVEKNGSADDEGFAYAARLVIGRITDIYLQDLGCSDEDIRQIRESYGGRRVVIDRFREVAERMRTELDSVRPDAVSLGHLMHELRVSEQDIHAANYKQAIAALPEKARETLLLEIANKAATMDYPVHDFAGIARIEPDFVIARARDIVEGIDAYFPEDAEREKRYLRRGHWLVVE